jgi:hypothetical protein
MANQAAIIAQQQKGMEALTAQLKEQAAQIQKVSAQLEVSKRAPQVVSYEKQVRDIRPSVSLWVSASASRALII